MAQVLIVEDCEDVVQLLCHAIEAAGHEAICVGAQIAAHAALDLRSFDLVICDIRLPDGSGEDIVLKALSMGIHLHRIQVDALGRMATTEYRNRRLCCVAGSEFRCPRSPRLRHWELRGSIATVVTRGLERALVNRNVRQAD